MRSRTLTLILLIILHLPAGVVRATDDAFAVPLDQDSPGIDQIFRRCFSDLRAAGHDPKRMPASKIGDCMRPELEAMAEFAYEISTAYPVSSLTRVAAEICTLERANALSERSKSKAKEGARSEKSSWQWLTRCLKEVRWIEHDEQAKRLRRARRDAE